MAVMTDPQRLIAWAKFMRRRLGDWNVTKTDLRAALDALDDWFDTNASTVNNIFPEPFKSNATTAQKAALLAYVLLERYEVI